MSPPRSAPRLALCLALLSAVILQLSLPPVAVEAAPPPSGGPPPGNSPLTPPSGSGRDGSSTGTERRRAVEPQGDKPDGKPTTKTASTKEPSARGASGRALSEKSASSKTASAKASAKAASGKAVSEKPPSRTASVKAPAKAESSRRVTAKAAVTKPLRGKSMTVTAPAQGPATARAKAPASAPEPASTDTRSASVGRKAPTAVALRSRGGGTPGACSYTVRKGDNLGRIAARHSVSQAELVSANRLPRQGALPLGKRLAIPDCEHRAGLERPTPPPEAWADGVHQARVGPRRVPTTLHIGLPDLRSTMSNLLWPIAGPITSPFGLRRTGWHAGIDIKADAGTPILAAAAGSVLVSGWERAYGRVVKIEHEDGFVTIYAHNLQNFVAAGDRVEAGAVIGTVGTSGRSTAYHLHFEVRRDGTAYNPLHILPERGVMVARGDEAGDTDAEEAEDESGR